MGWGGRLGDLFDTRWDMRDGWLMCYDWEVLCRIYGFSSFLAAQLRCCGALTLCAAHVQRLHGFDGEGALDILTGMRV